MLEDMAFSMAVLAIPYLLIYGWIILIRGFARLVNSFKSFSIPEKVVTQITHMFTYINHLKLRISFHLPLNIFAIRAGFHYKHLNHCSFEF